MATLENGSPDLLYNVYEFTFDPTDPSYDETLVKTYLAGLMGDAESAYFEPVPNYVTFSVNDPKATDMRYLQKTLTYDAWNA